MKVFIANILVISVFIMMTGFTNKERSVLKQNDVLKASKTNTIEVTLRDYGVDHSKRLHIYNVNAPAVTNTEGLLNRIRLFMRIRWNIIKLNFFKRWLMQFGNTQENKEEIQKIHRRIMELKKDRNRIIFLRKNKKYNELRQLVKGHTLSLRRTHNYIQSIYRIDHEEPHYGRYMITTKPMKSSMYVLMDAALNTIQFNVKEEGETITHGDQTYRTVISSGKVWLDRNLGSNQVCLDDSTSCQGDFFAWSYKFGATDGRICPVGFRVPYIDELERLFSSIQNRDQALNHELAIPIVGSQLNPAFGSQSSMGSCFSSENEFCLGTPDGDNGGIIVAPIGILSGNYSEDINFSSLSNTLGLDDHAILWSSTHGSKGYEYIYFSEKKYESYYNSGHARFQIRCVQD